MIKFMETVTYRHSVNKIMNCISSERITTGAGLRSDHQDYPSTMNKQKACAPVRLNEFEASLAMQLLRSVDERIASAARRIFSNVTTTTPHLADSISSSEQDMSKIKFSTSVEKYIGTVLCDSFKQNTYESYKDTASHEETSAPNVHQVKSTSEMNVDMQASDERLLRSRERNRIHARRTRQRKKEHMQSLQQHIDELRSEQVKLKQVINEKSTANILLDMCGGAGDEELIPEQKLDDPEVDQLLKRSAADIPTVPKTNVLPALILPRQGKKGKTQAVDYVEENKLIELTSPMLHAQGGNKDDINYELLGKDRSACTAVELDKIRRERNRMHAKRTRDRKRILMEEMQGVIKRLEGENQKLKEYAGTMSGPHSIESSPISTSTQSCSDPPSLSTTIMSGSQTTDSSLDSSPSHSVADTSSLSTSTSSIYPKCTTESSNVASSKEDSSANRKAISFHQLNNLLAAVTAFEEKEFVFESEINSSEKVNTVDDSDCMHLSKRMRLDGNRSVTSGVNITSI